MLSAHHQECTVCSRNLTCELQTLAKRMGIQENRFAGEMPPQLVDTSSPSVMRDTGKCILCRRCVTTCQEVQSVAQLFPVDRGFKTMIAPAGKKPLAEVACVACGQCINGLSRGRSQGERPHHASLGSPGRFGQARGGADRSGCARRYRRGVRDAGGEPGDRQDGRGAPRNGLRQGLRHRLHRRPHHYRGRQRASSAPEDRRDSADDHALLAGLDQLHRALLSRAAAASVQLQEPAADVRRACEDLLRGEDRG